MDQLCLADEWISAKKQEAFQIHLRQRELERQAEMAELALKEARMRSGRANECLNLMKAQPNMSEKIWTFQTGVCSSGIQKNGPGPDVISCHGSYWQAGSYSLSELMDQLKGKEDKVLVARLSQAAVTGATQQLSLERSPAPLVEWIKLQAPGVGEAMRDLLQASRAEEEAKSTERQVMMKVQGSEWKSRVL
jgi:hypothetical protein